MWSGKGSNCRPSAFQLVCRSDEGAQSILIWIYPDQDGAGAPFPVGISAPGWCQGQRPGRHRPCLAWPRTHSGPGRVTKRLDELCPGRPRRVPKYLAEVLVSGARAEEQLRGGLCVGGSHGDQPGDPLLRLRWIPWLCRSRRRHSAPWLQWVPLFFSSWWERYGASAPATS